MVEECGVNGGEGEGGVDHGLGMVEDGLRGEDEKGLAEGILGEFAVMGGVEMGQEVEGEVNRGVVVDISFFQAEGSPLLPCP